MACFYAVSAPGISHGTWHLGYRVISNRYYSLLQGYLGRRDPGETRESTCFLRKGAIVHASANARPSVLGGCNASVLGGCNRERKAICIYVHACARFSSARIRLPHKLGKTETGARSSAFIALTYRPAYGIPDDWYIQWVLHSATGLLGRSEQKSS